MMAYSSLFLVVFCCFFASALSASLHIKIPASTFIANPKTLPSSTHATLTSGLGETVQAPIRTDSTILIPNIQSAGSYLLKIYTRDYVFASYRIDITRSESDGSLISGAWETYLGSPWTDAGVPLIPATANNQPVSVPSLTIHPKILAKKQFYEERPGFSPLSLLKNPMILMGGLALAFTFGMPKLMENMDPEMRAEYEEMQKNSPMAGITRAMQGQSAPSGAGQSFDLAGYLAGQSAGTGSKSTGRDSGNNIRERRK